MEEMKLKLIKETKGENLETERRRIVSKYSLLLYETHNETRIYALLCTNQKIPPQKRCYQKQRQRNWFQISCQQH